MPKIEGYSRQESQENDKTPFVWKNDERPEYIKIEDAEEGMPSMSKARYVIHHEQGVGDNFRSDIIDQVDTKDSAREIAVEWMQGQNGVGDETIRQTIRDKVDRLANGQQARTWSTIGDQQRQELKQKGYEDLVQVAEFGDQVAINGDPEDLSEYDSYELYRSEEYEPTGHGGRVPSTEAEVQLDNLVGTAEELGVEKERFWNIVEELYGNKDLAYLSVSGRTKIYGKKIE